MTADFHALDTEVPSKHIIKNVLLILVATCVSMYVILAPSFLFPFLELFFGFCHFFQMCNVGAWTVMASAAARMGILEIAAHQLMLSLWLVIAFVQGQHRHRRHVVTKLLSLFDNVYIPPRRPFSILYTV